MRQIYIISGPAGVGKSTISKRLAKQFKQSAYIQGDLINHMVVGGYLPPWESEESLSLVWNNIADLSINFLQANKNVVIDYVAFPREVDTLLEKIYSKVNKVEVKYVVLWVEEDELLRRDSLRIKENQMGKRSLELMREFESLELNKCFMLETTNLKLADLDIIIRDIIENPAYIYHYL